jgi:hypothetical protein
LNKALLLTPWRDLGITGRDVNAIPSMIAPDEALYLYWLARCQYKGQGEIVDGGPLLGGSTSAMAEGLRLNPAVTNKTARIHSYDLFEYASPFMKRLFKRGPVPLRAKACFLDFRRTSSRGLRQCACIPGTSSHTSGRAPRSKSSSSTSRRRGTSSGTCCVSSSLT